MGKRNDENDRDQNSWSRLEFFGQVVFVLFMAFIFLKACAG